MADAMRDDLGDSLTGVEGTSLREPGRIVEGQDTEKRNE